MRAVSDAFLRTVAGSHAMAARARVCTTFQSGNQPTGTFVDIVDGDVASDATAQTRSTLDITIGGTLNGATLWPSRASDLLGPYGNEIYVERGVETANGSTEWVGLGYFRIDTPEQASPPDGPIRIAGSDRMAGIVDGSLTTPIQFPATATYGTVVSTLVGRVYPTAIIDWDDATNGVAIGRAVIVTDNVYQFLDDMFTAIGKIWYWDYRGHLTIRDQPGPSATPDVELVAGAGGVLVQSTRTITRVGVKNAWVVTGQGTDTLDPATAIVYDNNPSSPTYYNGRFGPVPGYFTSPFITDEPGAASAGQALLLRSVGLPYQINFQAVANPALEPWDTALIRQHTRMGVELHQLRNVTIPLVASRPMTAQTKEQTMVLVGRA